MVHCSGVYLCARWQCLTHARLSVKPNAMLLCDVLCLALPDRCNLVLTDVGACCRCDAAAAAAAAAAGC